jgi:dTDP-glucose 4,6-dehydratase
MIVMTGGTGYIGKTFANLVREKTDWSIICLNHSQWDFRHPWPIGDAVPKAKYFVHFGANVAARQSIDFPGLFVADNVVGTFNVLELARKIKPYLFVYISSAEALGGCEEGYLHEGAEMRPSNPYAATKGCGELLTYSYFRSYGLPAITVRTQGVWGLDQSDPTKYASIVRNSLQKGEPVKIHARNGKIGSRQWIEGPDFAQRLLDLLPVAKAGETYHIVGQEQDNIQQAQVIADRLGVPLKYELIEMSATHEFRYALVNTKREANPQ